MVGRTSHPAYTQNTSVVRSDRRSHDRITESNFVDGPCGVSIHERRLAVAAGRGTRVQAELQLCPARRPMMRQSLKIGVLPGAKGFHERREKLLKVGHKAQEFPSGIWYDKESRTRRLSLLQATPSACCPSRTQATSRSRLNYARRCMPLS
jgi:hypothetical protein